MFHTNDNIELKSLTDVPINEDYGNREENEKCSIEVQINSDTIMEVDGAVTTNDSPNKVLIFELL